MEKVPVYQYKKAKKDLETKGYYIRGRNYNPAEGHPCYKDIYILKNGEPELFAYNISPCRCRTLLKAYQNGTLQKVPSYVLENYITNGYNTRSGLFRNYDKKKSRMEKIAFSHAEIIGGYDSAAEHEARQRIRNN